MPDHRTLAHVNLDPLYALELWNSALLMNIFSLTFYYLLVCSRSKFPFRSGLVMKSGVLAVRCT